MCEAGRIVHHLSRGLSNPKNSVIIVGFMAEHTLGRRLVERRRKVKVLGLERDVFASIYTVGGLSAHADKNELLQFAKETFRRGALRRTVLVHGEDAPKMALKRALREAGIGEVVLSNPGLELEL
jgi:metallo-beta-lactamase family protein